jgi:hypothetical protein
MLRTIPAIQFVLGKFAALLRSDKGSGESLTGKFLGETPSVSRSTDQHFAVLKLSGDSIAAPTSNDQSDRERLIRRRWTESGIKMWNPDVHGAVLMGRIVCEGVVVDPPKRREK